MTDSQMTKTERFDLALEAAVVQSWAELAPGPSPSQVRVEYETGSDGSLVFMRVWLSSVRGCWKLVCEMWLQALWSNLIGLTFANHYRSVSLARALRLATQDLTPGSILPDRHGFILVQCPTAEHQADKPIPVAAIAAA